MPTYEYKCSHCGKVVEVHQSCNAPDFSLLPTCLECGHMMNRILPVFNNHYTPTRSNK